MNFSGFLGNEMLKERLSAAEKNRRLSHCYLITGPEGSGKHTLARLLAAALECRGTEKPCFLCPQCKKVMGGTHPDFITVDDPEKKTIPVKAVRLACEDLYIRPNEGQKKIYLFPRAHDLNPQGQNALLKCIEEPPEYGVFLLLSQHAERLLPTIRSRCVELRLAPISKPVLHRALRERFPEKAEGEISAAALRSGGYLGQAITFLDESSALLPQVKALSAALCKGSVSALLSVLVPMERLKREQLHSVLLQMRELVGTALTHQKGLPSPMPEAEQLSAACSLSSLLSFEEALCEAVSMLGSNVSPAHVCGLLSVLLAEC